MPTTQCTDVNKLIPTYLDGELAESELHSFELHLHECDSCAAEVDEEREFLARVRTALATPPAPDMFRARLSRALDAEEAEEAKVARKKRSAWILPGAATFAAAAALVVFVLDVAKPADNSNQQSAAVDRAAAPISADIAQSAGEFLRIPVKAPRFVNAEASPRSWRPLRNRNHDAALLVYDLKRNGERTRIEVQILDARNLDLRGAHRRVVRGTPVWVATAMGMNSVSVQDENGVGYIFNSYMDLDELMSLVVGVE